jgi:3-oxoacyl-[acyl-carrier-protein] synthase II
MAHTAGRNQQIINEFQLSSHFNRMTVPMTMPNTITSWISILFGMHGACFTVNTACSSGNYAIGEAYRKIKDGYNEIIIAGGIENFEDNTGTIMRGFDSLGALTRSPDGKPMPFSKQRSGFLFSEGAGCILILEEYERAVKRNAPIYAEIAGFESNSDAKNIVLMDEKGTDISSIIRKLSQDKTIDYINAHGTGTVLNDDIESKVIKNIFGDTSSQPLINSTKSILGHSIGASAALEAAICAMSVQRNVVHANLSVNNIDDLNIAETTTTKTINTALSLSYGFGGHNSGIVLKKCE